MAPAHAPAPEAGPPQIHHDGAVPEADIDTEWETRKNRFFNVGIKPPTSAIPSKPAPRDLHYRLHGLLQVGYMEGLDEGKAQTIQQGFDEGEQARAKPHARLCMQTICMRRAGHEASMLVQATGAGQRWAINRACRGAGRPHWLRLPCCQSDARHHDNDCSCTALEPLLNLLHLTALA